MTEAERIQAAKQFVKRWIDRGREDEDARSYWIEYIQNVLGVPNTTERVEFEKKVIGPDGNTKRIDVYIRETHTIIEQKSLGIALDKPQAGHDGMTPYEQAKMYDNYLPFDERARWIIVSNFAEIWIYDRNQKPVPVKIRLAELPDRPHVLDFIINKDTQRIANEMAVSLAAGAVVGKLYDAFLAQYIDPNDPETLKSLNKLCVRLVFCLFAEDAGIFGKKGMFHDYLKAYGWKMARSRLKALFEVFNLDESQRDKYLDDDLKAFPYVKGLFDDEEIEIPQFNEEIFNLLITNASEEFDWSKISPTIFGAVFESTLNPETRRSGGMHYTSVENIHKVIDPLFLDDLKDELGKIKGMKDTKTRAAKADAFQRKLGSLVFLDPACGSGNFLTETYLSIRHLENEALALRYGDQIIIGEALDPIHVSIEQFYGIEINDFAVAVAQTALWIAESQTMAETESIVHQQLNYLPLRTYAGIREANALRIDWGEVVPKERLSYIMGNPPFVGARLMSSSQKDDVFYVFGKDWKNVGNLDYVCCWYMRAAEIMEGTQIRAALVSTNSITQGEAVSDLWKPLFDQNVHIDYAYRTFIWDSEASIKAHVHCVIIGFSTVPNGKQKLIYDGDKIIHATNINGYLLDADNISISSRNKPLYDVPEIGIGNKPIDGGYYLFSREEMEEFIKNEPKSAEYFHPWYGSVEFINRKPRYCLWLGDCSPAELRSMPECMKRIQAVRDYRLSSPSPGTVKLADRPTRFHVENMPKGHYIVIPEVSSQRRRFVPMGYMDDSVLCSNKVRLMPEATLYHFGILESSVHMGWMRVVCGRLKSDYDYSIKIVYNNFPWPDPTEDQRQKIEQTAQEILDARAIYPDCSLADLYDPLTMPPELLSAHQANDRAVINAYGMPKDIKEPAIVAWLMKLYLEKTKT